MIGTAKAQDRSELLRGVRLDPQRVCVKKLRSGQMAIDRIGTVACVGLVLQGSIDVYSVAFDGCEIKLSSLHEGQMFGICNLFAPDDLTTVLRSRQSTDVLFIPKDYLIELMHEDSELMLRYLKLCNEKIQFLLRRIEELTMQTSRMKLLSYLRNHATRDGLVVLDGTREDIARYLGISRATLFREMACLKREGNIVSREGDLYVRMRDVDRRASSEDRCS